MTSVDRRPDARVRRHRAAAPPADVATVKLTVPIGRAGDVTRSELLERLLGAAGVPVIAVVAPAGYGKTTLLAQWAQRKQPRVVWLSLDDRDNDPVALLEQIATAIDRVERIDPHVFRALASPVGGLSAVGALAGAIAALSAPVAIVVDQCEALTARSCLDAMCELALLLPSGSQLALGSRSTLPIPVPRLRARRAIVEVGVADLAMSEAEATAFLATHAPDLAADVRATIVRRTEGWPAGLYLATLAATRDRDLALDGVFSGEERFIADYLRLELLEQATPTDATFLRRTSILDNVCGPLCDATVPETRSGLVLEELERRNMLVIPLDGQRQWYRYHNLFRDLLRRELTQHEPEVVVGLHVRAAAWYAQNGSVEAAVAHAQAAGDADLAAELVARHGQLTFASGRVETVRRWYGWFDDRGVSHRYPHVATLAAIVEAAMGHAAGAERWAHVAEQNPFDDVLPDGSTIEAWRAVLRALLARDGVDRMRHDAGEAVATLSPTSPLRGVALTLQAMAELLAGDPDGADPVLAHGADVALYDGATAGAAAALAGRAVVAMGRNDWSAATAFAQQGLNVVEKRDLTDYLVALPVFAVLARTAIHAGDVTAARVYAARAMRLRAQCSPAVPAFVFFLVQLAHAYLELADPAGARATVDQVRDILQRRPDLGVVVGQVEALRSRLEATSADALGASSLTVAELRLLPLLATHLTLGEIAERLYLSRNTVKTQAISIYRKLGVSSRSDAIASVNALGLLG